MFTSLLRVGDGAGKYLINRPFVDFLYFSMGGAEWGGGEGGCLFHFPVTSEQ